MEGTADTAAGIGAIPAGATPGAINGHTPEVEATVAEATAGAEAEAEAEVEAEAGVEVEVERPAAAEVEAWIEEETHMIRKEATLEACLTKIGEKITDPHQNRDLDLTLGQILDPPRGPIREDTNRLYYVGGCERAFPTGTTVRIDLHICVFSC